MSVSVSASSLREQLTSILAAWGMQDDHIKMACDVMIDTDLRGIDSHGMGMLPAYNNWRKAGLINVAGNIQRVTDLPSLSLIDGGQSMGHAVGVISMELAIEKASTTGIGMVTAKGSNHYGAAGYYAKMAVETGFLGVSMTGTPGAAMVPTFGKKKILGTNPIAFAAPARRNPPFILDMATSTVALGKLAIAQRLGLPVPEGWALDIEGQPTTDPAIGRETRNLTPLGGTRELGSHKGYGLAAMVDIFSSTLSGASIHQVGNKADAPNVIGDIGHFFMAIDPKALRGDDSFPDEVDDLIDALHKTPPIEEGISVLVAGDPEITAFEERSKNGIPLSDKLAGEIKQVAEDSGVAFTL